MYPPELVKPMKEDLTQSGFQELTTAQDVENILSDKSKTTFLVINSVCGCAARNARPAAKMAQTESEYKPDQFVTVFAGVDSEAVAKAREFMLPYPASSPSMALFKNGELVHMIERHHIEGKPAEMIADNIMMAFDEYCNKN